MNETVSSTEAPSPARYALGQLVRYMLALGAWGFGGPVALVGRTQALEQELRRLSRTRLSSARPELAVE